jgi:uncharacterized protein with HEPN domain
MPDATEMALSFVSGIDEDAFLQNQRKIFAVTHAPEGTGEAAKHVPVTVRRRSTPISRGDRLQERGTS